jgi:DNA-binding response OmpR family regulator
MGTVLVIDDDESVLMLAQALLKRANHRVLVATNGYDGIRIAEAELPDIIIVDDMLPKMSGRDICLALKENSATQYIPVIISSASMDRDNANYTQNMGADGLLIKPFHVNDMMNLLSRFLEF